MAIRGLIEMKDEKKEILASEKEINKAVKYGNWITAKHHAQHIIFLVGELEKKEMAELLEKMDMVKEMEKADGDV
jgi:uncharacterized protein YjcR